MGPSGVRDLLVGLLVELVRRGRSLFDRLKCDRLLKVDERQVICAVSHHMRPDRLPGLRAYLDHVAALRVFPAGAEARDRAHPHLFELHEAMKTQFGIELGVLAIEDHDHFPTEMRDGHGRDVVDATDEEPELPHRVLVDPLLQGISQDVRASRMGKPEDDEFVTVVHSAQEIDRIPDRALEVPAISTQVPALLVLESTSLVGKVPEPQPLFKGPGAFPLPRLHLHEDAAVEEPTSRVQLGGESVVLADHPVLASTQIQLHIGLGDSRVMTPGHDDVTE